MSQQFPELALAAADSSSQRHEARDCIGIATGPGWFDSSWDLHRGLEVRERWSDDERVHRWIDDFLRNQRRIDRSGFAGTGRRPVDRGEPTVDVSGQR